MLIHFKKELISWIEINGEMDAQYFQDQDQLLENFKMRSKSDK